MGVNYKLSYSRPRSDDEGKLGTKLDCMYVVNYAFSKLITRSTKENVM